MTIAAKKIDTLEPVTIGPLDDDKLEIGAGAWQVSYTIDTRLGPLGSSALIRAGDDVVVELRLDDIPEGVTSYLSYEQGNMRSRVGLATMADLNYTPPAEVERVDLEIDLAMAGIERRYVKDIQHAVAEAVEDYLGHGPAMTTRVTDLPVDEIQEPKEELE